MNIINYRPPRIAMSLTIMSALAYWLLPVMETDLYNNRTLGLITGVAGFLIMMWGWWLFKLNRTAICPIAQTTCLVTGGIYRVTRNPMYLGICLMLFGLAIYIGALSFYLSASVFFLIINRFFCPYEENKLSDIFGDQYLNYQRSVRRWI